jgi:hypothetical protein
MAMARRRGEVENLWIPTNETITPPQGMQAFAGAGAAVVEQQSGAIIRRVSNRRTGL